MASRQTPEQRRALYASDPKRYAAYSYAWIRRNPHRYIWKTAKHRALKRGIEFSITPDDVLVPDSCPILGIPLVLSQWDKPGGKPNSPSLDRIDPAKGYVPGNVRVISHQANSMKWAASADELRAFARWVRDEFGE